MTQHVFELSFWLLVAHAVCDYPLQGDWLSKLKNLSFDGAGRGLWAHGLTMHSLIQAGGVMLVLGSLPLAIAEFLAHWSIDYCKCAGKISYRTDQWLHMACKALWLTLFVTVHP